MQTAMNNEVAHDPAVSYFGSTCKLSHAGMTLRDESHVGPSREFRWPCAMSRRRPPLNTKSLKTARDKSILPLQKENFTIKFTAINHELSSTLEFVSILLEQGRLVNFGGPVP
ncbi:hypothetical protein Tco_1310821 [Tanacetum coccineum]